MKKILSILMVIASVFALTACGGGGSKTYEIAVVTDIGMLMDGGFNQGTWEGAKAYAENKGKTCQYYQPANSADATDNDRLAAMRQAIKNGAKEVIAVGFLQANAIEICAKENPDVKFIFVDGWALGLDNVTAIVYKEEESGYMAGYAAVMDGYRKLGVTIGGGGTSPACNRYGYGYVQGICDAAKKENADCTVKYSYKYGEGFSASTELQAQISSWYVDGTEVIFACGGSMVQSVKSAAEETNNGKIIGVDVDQYNISDRVITSAIKGLSVSVQKILSAIYEGKWDSELANKAVSLGATDDATGLAMNNARFNKFTESQYNEMFNGIKNGSIKIDANTQDDCNDAGWLNNISAKNPNVTIEFEK